MGSPFADHLFDHRDQHGHAEVFKRSGVRVAALLNPEIFEVKLLAVTIGPEEIGIALEGRDNILVVDERNHPFLLRPYARAVRVVVLAQAIIE